ncbi:response regulator, partial [Vibrio parahaemolyticus AQ3810]
TERRWFAYVGKISIKLAKGWGICLNLRLIMKLF